MILPFATGDGLAWLAATLRAFHAIGFWGLVLSWTVVASLVILPAAVVAGYQFPLLVALLGRDHDQVGHEVGLTYAWNTTGAIVGSLAGGFGLLPLLSAPRLWRASTLLLVLLALTAALVDRSKVSVPHRLLPLGVALLSAVLCLVSAGPSAFWRHSSIGAGRMLSSFKGPNDLAWNIRDARAALLREAEGRESSIALLVRHELSLQVNGKSDGSARGDAPTQVMGGLVGALLHPDPQRALVIGMGTGSTGGWLAAVDSCTQVDIVELEPAVVEFAREFHGVNADVLHSPKVRILDGDGREYVLSNPATYDLIFSEPSNPYRAGVADLFSQDFYRVLSHRLRPNGIFMQWLQGYEADAEVVETVFATLRSVFPHVETWQIHSLDLLLVAANEPIVHDFDQIRRRATAEPFKSALLRTWGMQGVEGFYSGFLANPQLATAFAQQATALPSTDDRPRVEFSFARNVGRGRLFQVEDLFPIAARLHADRPTPARGQPIDWDLVQEYRQLRASHGLGSFANVAFEQAIDDRKARYLARQAYGADKDLATAFRLWFQQQDPEPKNFLDLLLVAETLADRGDSLALPYVEQVAELAPTEAVALRARLARRQGDLASATQYLIEAFERCRQDPWFYIPLVDRLLTLTEETAKAYPAAAERLLQVLDQPLAGYVLEMDRLRLRIPLTAAIDHCAEGFAPFEPDVPWEEFFLEARAKCYDQTGHPLAEQAMTDLWKFQEAGTPRFAVGSE